MTTTRATRWISILATQLLGILVVCPLHGQEQVSEPTELRSVTLDDSARTSFEAGAAAYEAGRYETALRAFRAGYQLSPRPEFLFNIGLCLEQLGRPQEAAAQYQQFLEEEPRESARGLAEEKLAALRNANLDLGPVGDDEGAETSDGGALRTAGTVALVLGGAGAVAFAVAAPLALVRRNEIDDCTPRCDEGFVDEGRTRAVVADVGLGVGVAGLGAGLLLLLLANDEPEDQEGVSLLPGTFALAEDHAYLSVAGNF